MSHTNTTTNYGLPQFLSSDKPAWMADINVAFADIDSQMKTNADAASAAQSTADDSVLNGAPGYSNLSTYAVGDVVNYLGRVYKCDIAVTTPEAFDNAKWSYYRLSDASAQLDVIDGEIGSTDISSIGDGTITDAISTVNSNLSASDIGTDVVIWNGTGSAPSSYIAPSDGYLWAYIASDNKYMSFRISGKMPTTCSRNASIPSNASPVFIRKGTTITNIASNDTSGNTSLGFFPLI